MRLETLKRRMEVGRYSEIRTGALRYSTVRIRNLEITLIGTVYGIVDLLQNVDKLQF